MPSTASPARATTSPTTRRLPPRRRSAASTAWAPSSTARRARTRPRRWRCAASLAETGLSAQHCHDVLRAFTLDATKLRYRDWDDLMEYCRYSAAPVGRQVLDLHGESRTIAGPPSDALCAALQVLNHLQDCVEDYHALDRVYLPRRDLAACGSAVADLDRAQREPGAAPRHRPAAGRHRRADRAGAPLAARRQEPGLAARDAPSSLRSPSGWRAGCAAAIPWRCASSSPVAISPRRCCSGSGAAGAGGG